MKTVAFFQSVDLLTGIPRTFVTIGNEFFSDAAFNSAFSTMRGLFALVCKTAAAGLRMQTVPVTYPAIHSAGGRIDPFLCLLSAFSWQLLLYAK